MTLRSQVLHFANSSLSAAGRLFPLGLSRRMIHRSPIGFFYHTISDEALPHVRHLYPYKSRSAFVQDILYIQRHFTLVGYDDLLAYANGTSSLPPNAAFLSFDDGFSECYSVVRPILLQHQVPCIFFLATDWVDNRAFYYRGLISLILEEIDRRPAGLQALFAVPGLGAPLDDFQSFSSWLLARQHRDRPLLDAICEVLEIDIDAYLAERRPFLTTEQVREMQDQGFAFGAHTRDHPKLMNLPEDAQREEIIESCRIVCELTGRDQVPFAFPFSGHRVDRGMLEAVRAEHPHVGLIFDTKQMDRDRPFIFNRIIVDKPVAGVPDEKNIAYWLKRAYAGQVHL